MAGYHFHILESSVTTLESRRAPPFCGLVRLLRLDDMDNDLGCLACTPPPPGVGREAHVVIRPVTRCCDRFLLPIVQQTITANFPRIQIVHLHTHESH